ncbi:hypothetical protein HY493_05040 [Candidatus Woesearchaeota archaeon]|nr:hypothetical protein [Candidatus Woesearchaeota archaeon]
MRLLSIILGFLLFLLVPSVSAVGITPAKIILEYRPIEYSLDFTIMNAEAIDTYVAGDLAQYAEIIDPAPGTGPRQFRVILRLPPDLEPPGKRVLFVGAIEHVPEGAATVGARAAIQAPVYVFVPYPGIYLEPELIAPSVNENEPVNMTLTIVNRGRDPVSALSAQVLVIDDVTNKTLATLTAEPVRIEGDRSKDIRFDWESRGSRPGPYRAKAVIRYDDQIMEREAGFRIGTQIVRIINFTQEVLAGSINPFEVTVKSEWNSPFSSVYADVTINDQTFKTPYVTLDPWQLGTLVGYWDATSVAPGTYDADIILHYGDLTARVNGPVRVVTRTVGESPQSFGSGWIRTAFALLIVVIALIFFIRRRKREA